MISEPQNFEAILETTRSILNKLEELHLETIKTEIIFSGKNFELPTDSKFKIILSGIIGENKQEEFNTFKDYIKALESPQISFDCDCIKGLHTKIKNSNNIINSTNSEEVELFKDDLNVITILAFWTSQDAQMFNVLNEIDTMFRAYKEQWNEKVRIIPICVDNNTEDLDKIKSIADMSFGNSYYFKNGKENQMIKDYDINELPFVILADSGNVIQFLGHYASIDLEQAINNFLNVGKINIDGAISSLNNPVSLTDKDELIEKFKAFKSEHINLIEKMTKFNFDISLSKIVNETNLDDNMFDGKLGFYVLSEACDKNDIQAVIKDIQKFNESVVKFKIFQNYYFKLKKLLITGRVCHKCSKAISDIDEKFICPICLDNDTNYTLCFDCVPEVEKEDFINNPVHEHHLYYIPKNSELNLPYMNNILTSCKIDNDVNYNTEKYVNGYVCDNCDKRVSVCNWSCSNCFKNVSGSYDLCDSCFVSFNENGVSNTSEHESNHIMARIPYTLSVSKGSLEKIKP
jgi:hypothetical protein